MGNTVSIGTGGANFSGEVGTTGPSFTSGPGLPTGFGAAIEAERQRIIDDQTQVNLQSEIDRRAREIADQIIADLARQNQAAANGRVFTRFDLASDVIENQKTEVTTGVFSGNEATLNAVYTSSAQSVSSKNYFYDIFNGTASTSESQFAVAYGHRLGSGSSALGTLNDSPTRAIYSQYRLLLLQPTDTTFTFANSTDSNSVYFVNYTRARIKEKLDAGAWELTLGQLSGSAVPNNVHTGSNVRLADSPSFITLIDDSSNTTVTNVVNGARVFNIVSGSLIDGVYSSSSPVFYGLAYPDLGILALNADILDVSASFNTVTGSNIAGDNAFKLFTAISGAMATSTTFAAQGRSAETVSSTHYFVRVKNAEYNFSNNPTFVTGSVGEIAQPTFIGDPKVYITTIGMYNNRQELLAVGKLSQPIKKTFSNEVLIKVKLDF
jgi:hypothetical protein